MKSYFLPILIVLISFTNSCTKDEDSPVVNNTTTPTTPPSPILKLDKSAYYQFEVAELSVQNLSLNSEVYTASIDTVSLELRSLEGNLYFITPDLPSGVYTLSSNVEGQAISFTLSINNVAVVSDPVSYIDQVKGDVFEISVADSILARLNDLDPSPDHLSNYNSYKNLQAEFDAQLALLNNQEKAALAKFFKANEEVFNFSQPDVLKDSLNMTKSALGRLDAYIESRVNSGRISLKIAALSLFTGGYALSTCLGSGLTAWPACLVSIAALGNGYRILWKFHNDIKTELDRTFILFNTDVSEMNQKSFQLDHDATYRLKIRGERRTLYNADMNTKIPVLASFFEVCDTAEVYWNRLRDYVNRAAEKFTGNYDLVGKFPHPKRLSTFRSQWINETADYFSVGSISNSKVSLKSQNVINNHIEVVFSNADTADHDFDFSLIYNDGINSMNTRVKARIKGRDSILSILGNWNLKESRHLDQGIMVPVGNWRYYESSIIAGTCTLNTVDQRDKYLSGNLNISANQFVVSYNEVDEGRTVNYDLQDCKILSYGPWTSRSSGTDTYTYNYTLLGSNQMRLVEAGQTSSITIEYNLTNDRFTLSPVGGPVDEIYER